jgi:hypothetical protein
LFLSLLGLAALGTWIDTGQDTPKEGKLFERRNSELRKQITNGLIEAYVTDWQNKGLIYYIIISLGLLMEVKFRYFLNFGAIRR